MKKKRLHRILQLIREQEINTQEELAERLSQEGYPVTQATVSRDIRELRLIKVQKKEGGFFYSLQEPVRSQGDQKYTRVLRDGVLSMGVGREILVIRTMSGMAMAVAAALDAMQLEQVAGCIAGDDTIMVALTSEGYTEEVMVLIRNIMNRQEV